MMFLMLAVAAAEPNSGVSFTLTELDLRSMPYVEAYTNCFERAAVETKAATVEESARRYGQCHSARPELIAKHYAQSPSLGARANRDLEQAFSIIERAYAKALAKRSKQD